MTGGGGYEWEWYQLKRYAFPYNRRCFLDTLKGLISCFKSQKNGFNVSGQKKGVSVLMWLTQAKS
jgi:hypothetical protein